LINQLENIEIKKKISKNIKKCRYVLFVRHFETIPGIIVPVGEFVFDIQPCRAINNVIKKKSYVTRTSWILRQAARRTDGRFFRAGNANGKKKKS